MIHKNKISNQNEISDIGLNFWPSVAKSKVDHVKTVEEEETFNQQS